MIDTITSEQVPAVESTPTSDGSARGFFGRDLIYTVLWASQMGLTTLITAVVTRILGSGEYGIAATCITVMQLLSAIGGFGLQIGVQRVHARRGDDAARQLVTVAYAVGAVVYLIVALTGFLWARRVGLGGFDGAASFTVLWAGCTGVTNATLGLLRSRDQLAGFIIVNVLQGVLAEVISLVLILVVSRTAKDYVLGEMLGQAAALVVGLVLTRPLGFGRRDLRFIRDTLNFCAPLVPQMVAMFVLSASDRLVVNASAGHVAAGRYAIASNLGSIPQILITSLAASWMPRVFAMSVSGDISKPLRQTRDLLYLLLVPMVFGIGVGSPLLLRVWAPSSFHPDGLQLETALIVAAALPFAATTTHERMLFAHGRTRSTAVATIVAAALNLALNLVLVPPWGILGAAISTLVAVCVMDLILVRACVSLTPLRRPRPLVIAWIVLGLGLMFCAVLLPTTWPFLIFRGAVTAGAGVVALVLLRAFAPSGASKRTGAPGARQWLSARTDLDL